MKNFSEKYRSPIALALFLGLLLGFLSTFVPDQGVGITAFIYSLGVFVALLLLIMLRRPATPSKFDLLLVGWGLPVLFIAFIFLLPVAWRFRGILWRY